MLLDLDLDLEGWNVVVFPFRLGWKGDDNDVFDVGLHWVQCGLEQTSLQ